MKYNLYISILMSIFTMYSCSKNEAMVIVDNEMQVHFDMFENEAKIRDLDIDLEAQQVNGYIVQINADKVIGQSVVEGLKITIKVDPDYWSNATYEDRELLVFHELGHAVLGRIHLDEMTLFKQCKSIMRSSSSICNCNYNKSTRRAYIDELFN